MAVSLISLISTILFGVAVAVVRWRSYLFGKTVEKAKAQEKVIDDLKEGNQAIVRARGDTSIADRLRDRYKL